MNLPSLLHSAELEFGPPSVRRRGVAPRFEVSSSHRAVRPLFASISVERSVYATRFPSGATATSEILSMRTRSWTLNGSAGSAGGEGAAAVRLATQQRLKAESERSASMA